MEGLKGAHRVLEREKQRLQDEVDRRMDSIAVAILTPLLIWMIQRLLERLGV